MLKNNIFISVFVMIFGIAGISTAVELSSNQIAGQSNIPAQAAGTELCTSCTSGQISAVDNKCVNTDSAIQAKQQEYLNISEVKEIPSSKITVRYNDVNVIIPVAKNAVNIIKVPYSIKFLDSSKFCPDKAPVTVKCIADVGKSEYQLSIVPLPDIDTDLAVMTSEKTFVITLRPVQKAASFIEIIDIGKKEAKAIDEKEKSLPHVELLIELIKKTLRGDEIDGYSKRSVSKIFETLEYTFIMKKEISGSRLKIVQIDVLNKTNRVVELQDNSEFIGNIISKIAGKPLARNVSREFLQPRNAETERKGEFISTITAVVRGDR
ncbi:MAG: hypothetical protein A2X55_08860 [Nitrospirae bacterium GWB2_47_37]|nr:MAG: hypothetical protein A2X55_08860 [Nitrospirae bacterium GWB2_47_37]HAK87621.1 hypothetical protein [Nitrospiraceae bacterium]